MIKKILFINIILYNLIIAQINSLDSLDAIINREKKILDSLYNKSTKLSEKIVIIQKKIDLLKKMQKKILTKKKTTEKKIAKIKLDLVKIDEKYNDYYNKLENMIKTIYILNTNLKTLSKFPILNNNYFIQNKFYIEEISKNLSIKINSLKDSIHILNKTIEEYNNLQKTYANLLTKQYKTEKSLMAQKDILKAEFDKIQKSKNLMKVLFEEKVEDRKRISEFIKNFSKSPTQYSLKNTDREFEKYKGKLPYPIHGKIISLFGKHKDNKYNTYVFMNGIELKPKNENTVKSIFDGIVKYADWHRSYGKFIIIQHSSSYFSIYGHLENFTVKPGDYISKNDIIGYIGKTGTTTTKKLFFAIYKKDKPINPQIWLKKDK